MAQPVNTRLCLLLITPLALACYLWDGLRIGFRFFLYDWRQEWRSLESA